MTINKLTGKGKCEDNIVAWTVHGEPDEQYRLIYRMIDIPIKEPDDNGGGAYSWGTPNDKHFAIDREYPDGRFENRIAEVFIGGPYFVDEPRIISTKIKASESLIENILNDLRYHSEFGAIRAEGTLRAYTDKAGVLPHIDQ
jgi:hypothetical protein